MQLSNSELMGWFGFSWIEKIQKNTKNFLTNDQYKMVTVDMVKVIHDKYFALLNSGYKPISFINNTNILTASYNSDSIELLNKIKNDLGVNIAFVNAVLRSIYFCAVNGIISYDRLDPKQVNSDLQSGKVFNKNILEKLFKPTMGPLFYIGGTGLAVLFLLNRKGGN